MADIVERLQNTEFAFEPPLAAIDLMEEAVDEITRLRAEVKSKNAQFQSYARRMEMEMIKLESDLWLKIERVRSALVECQMELDAHYRAENAKLRGAIETTNALVERIYGNHQVADMIRASATQVQG